MARTETLCPHCNKPIRFADTSIRAAGMLWHRACADDAFAAANWPRGDHWPEDFELESRRHEDTLAGAVAQAHRYHIERGI